MMLGNSGGLPNGIYANPNVGMGSVVIRSLPSGGGGGISAPGPMFVNPSGSKLGGSSIFLSPAAAGIVESTFYPKSTSAFNTAANIPVPADQVPDGGKTAIFLGSVLLGMFALGRRWARRSGTKQN